MKLSKEQLISALHSLNPVEHNDHELEIECPSCHHRECHISITEDNHVFGCFREKHCGLKGNIYTLRQFGIKVSNWDRVTKLDDEFQKIDIKVFGQSHDSVSLQPIKLPLSYKRIYDSEYLNGRNWIKRDYEYWETGRVSFGSLKNYVIFPIYQDNEIKARVARFHSDECDKKDRYRNSDGEAFKHIIGGSDHLNGTKTIILCEGIFDIINVTRLLELYDSDSLKAVCTFGAKVSENQIKLLQSKGIKRIIILFDGDVIKKIKPIALTLAIYFQVEVGLLPEEVDAGDCNLEQLLNTLDNTQNPLEFNLERL